MTNGSSAPNMLPLNPSNRPSETRRPPLTTRAVSLASPPRVYTSPPSFTLVAPGCICTAWNTSAAPPAVRRTSDRDTDFTDGEATLGAADATILTAVKTGGTEGSRGAEGTGGAEGGEFDAPSVSFFSSGSLGKSLSPRDHSAFALSTWPSRLNCRPRATNTRANIGLSFLSPCICSSVSYSFAARLPLPRKGGD